MYWKNLSPIFKRNLSLEISKANSPRCAGMRRDVPGEESLSHPTSSSPHGPPPATPQANPLTKPDSHPPLLGSNFLILTVAFLSLKLAKKLNHILPLVIITMNVSYVSLSPLRSRCQEGMKRARML